MTEQSNLEIVENQQFHVCRRHGVVLLPDLATIEHDMNQIR